MKYKEIIFPRYFGMETSKSDRAKCFSCKRKIFKGEMRIISTYDFIRSRKGYTQNLQGKGYLCSRCSLHILKIYQNDISYARELTKRWLRRNKYKYALHEL